MRHDDNVGHNKQFVGHFENTRDGTSADSLEIYGKISVLALGRSSLAAASIVDAAQANERLFFSGNPTGKPPYICIFCAISLKNNSSWEDAQCHLVAKQGNILFFLGVAAGNVGKC